MLDIKGMRFPLDVILLCHQKRVFLYGEWVEQNVLERRCCTDKSMVE